MRLHEDKALFAEVILRASQPKENGGIGVNAGFIEKDYWITRALQQMSRSAAKDVAVFKGGTSLSKVYGIGVRFSEDVDVAIVRSDGMTDAGLKTIIRSTEKAMADGLTPIERPGLTSKGSRYRKSYFLYPQVEGIAPIGSMIPGQLEKARGIDPFGHAPFPAYINYDKFEELTDRGVVYVTKMKKSLRYEVLADCMEMNSDGLMTYREQIVVFRKDDINASSG